MVSLPGPEVDARQELTYTPTSRSTLIINSGRYDTIPGGIEGLKADLHKFREELNKYGLNLIEPQKPCIINIAPGILEDAKRHPELVDTIMDLNEN